MSSQLSNINSATNSIVYYSTIITLPIGIIGNLFSFYIYTRPNLNKKTNTGFIFAWFCLLNLVLILYFSFVFRSSSLFGYNVILPTPCSLNYIVYMLRSIWCCVPWIQVLASFDRFIFVVYPLKKHVMSKKWVLCLILLGILLFVVAINSANIVTVTTTRTTASGFVITFCSQTADANIATTVLTIVSRIYIPFAFMLTLNLIVLRRLRQSKIKVGVANVTRMGQQKNQPGQLSSKEYKFIVSMLIIDITFFVFYTPLAVTMTLYSVSTIHTTLFDSVTDAWIFLVYSTAQALALIYSVSSFFIFAVFNRYFRGEVIAVLHLKRFLPRVFNESISVLNDTLQKQSKKPKTSNVNTSGSKNSVFLNRNESST
jgi:hypothetical protein